MYLLLFILVVHSKADVQSLGDTLHKLVHDQLDYLTDDETDISAFTSKCSDVNPTNCDTGQKKEQLKNSGNKPDKGNSKGEKIQYQKDD